MSSFPWRALALVLLALSPTALLGTLLANPTLNPVLDVPLEHFVVTSNVSIVALAVGLLVARSALQLRHFPSLLLALGFICLAAIFAVHGLSTPGVLQRGEKEAEAGLVVGVSAQLALWAAALLFALRASPLASWIGRRVDHAAFFAAVLGLLVTYFVVGLVWPGALGGLARALLLGAGGSPTYDYTAPSYAEPPTSGAGWLPWIAIGTTITLLTFAAVRQAADVVHARRPLQGALALSFVLLAQAQISQAIAPVWSVAWWEYHGLMLAAVVLALGALFVELDRRRGLERFLPPNVVSRVIAGDALNLGGERVVATILFTDMRGSTALAERLPPEGIVEVLNAYLRVMASCVIAEGGILDKFLGDGLMAIFGALGEEGAGAPAAARAALAIRDRVAALTEERRARAEATVGVGVGIHTGEVVLGAVGLPERSDYTAIGDTVNTASRMESLTKEFRVDSVISGQTAERLAGTGIAVRSLGPVEIRGKALPLPVFTLVGS